MPDNRVLSEVLFSIADQLEGQQPDQLDSLLFAPLATAKEQLPGTTPEASATPDKTTEPSKETSPDVGAVFIAELMKSLTSVQQRYKVIPPQPQPPALSTSTEPAKPPTGSTGSTQDAGTAQQTATGLLGLLNWVVGSVRNRWQLPAGNLGPPPQGPLTAAEKQAAKDDNTSPVGKVFTPTPVAQEPPKESVEQQYDPTILFQPILGAITEKLSPAAPPTPPAPVQAQSPIVPAQFLSASPTKETTIIEKAVPGTSPPAAPTPYRETTPTPMPTGAQSEVSTRSLIVPTETTIKNLSSLSTTSEKSREQSTLSTSKEKESVERETVQFVGAFIRELAEVLKQAMYREGMGETVPVAGGNIHIPDKQTRSPSEPPRLFSETAPTEISKIYSTSALSSRVSERSTSESERETVVDRPSTGPSVPPTTLIPYKTPAEFSPPVTRLESATLNNNATSHLLTTTLESIKEGMAPITRLGDILGDTTTVTGGDTRLGDTTTVTGGDTRLGDTTTVTGGDTRLGDTTLYVPPTPPTGSPTTLHLPTPTPPTGSPTTLYVPPAPPPGSPTTLYVPPTAPAGSGTTPPLPPVSETVAPGSSGGPRQPQPGRGTVKSPLSAAIPQLMTGNANNPTTPLPTSAPYVPPNPYLDPLLPGNVEKDPDSPVAKKKKKRWFDKSIEKDWFDDLPKTLAMPKRLQQGYDRTSASLGDFFTAGTSMGSKGETGGIGSALGAAGNVASVIPGGQGASAALKFSESLFDAVDSLEKWTDSLHQSNMRFAEFSASMAMVGAQQRSREIQLGREQGERRAPSANYLAEGKSDLARALAPIQDHLAAGRNMIGGAINKGLADIVNGLNKILTKLGILDEMKPDKKVNSADDYMAYEGIKTLVEDYGFDDKKLPF
jgi:hypothetical protein